MYALKLKRVYLKQKHALCIVFSKDKRTHSKPAFFFWKPQCIEFILNKHYQHLNFMHKLSLIKSRQYSLISWKDDINNKEEKGIQSYSFFQKKIKSKLIVIENETGYF